MPLRSGRVRRGGLKCLYISVPQGRGEKRTVTSTGRWSEATASGSTYLFSAFWAGAVGNAIPGIVLQLVLIPPVVYALLRTRLVQPKR